METDFKKLFEYNCWANSKLISGLKEQNAADEKVLRLLSHILLSEQIWMLRLEGGEYSNKNFWKVLTLDECEYVLDENRKKFKGFVGKKNSADLITYENSKGIKYTNSVYDVLTHVVFHSSYHRGQIAREVRMLKKEPVLSDYIAYIRENNL